MIVGHSSVLQPYLACLIMFRWITQVCFYIKVQTQENFFFPHCTEGQTIQVIDSRINFFLIFSFWQWGSNMLISVSSKMAFKHIFECNILVLTCYKEIKMKYRIKWLTEMQTTCPIMEFNFKENSYFRHNMLSLKPLKTWVFIYSMTK